MSNDNLDKIKEELQQENQKQELTNETIQELIEEVRSVKQTNNALMDEIKRLADEGMPLKETGRKAIKNLTDSVNRIPKQVNIVKENTVSLKDRTKQFLLIFCSVAFLLIGASTYAAFYFYHNYDKAEQTGYNDGYDEGAADMRQYLIEEMPRASSDWIKTNVPEQK